MGENFLKLSFLQYESGYLENLQKSSEVRIFSWIPCNFLVSGSQELGALKYSGSHIV